MYPGCQYFSDFGQGGGLNHCDQVKWPRNEVNPGDCFELFESGDNLSVSADRSFN